MATLDEGSNVALSALPANGAQYSLIHVKLTDSALRALEEFQKIKSATDRRPTININGSSGGITVPIKKSSENTEGLQTFQFSLSSIQSDPNGSYECVQHSANGGLSMIGTMNTKLSIHAQDDVYESTKKSMRLADEESKKSCAKEIKPHMSRRVVKKVVRPASSVLPSASLRTPGASGASNRMSGSGSGASSAHRSHSPTPRSIPSKPPTQGTNHTIVNLPLRDRIIHLLAIRPYRKPELLIRLHKDGVRDRERSVIEDTLKTVGVLNNRDNSYSLAKYLYNEVRMDWPGYTETDRQLLKRRLASLETTKKSPASESPAISPVHSIGSQQGASPASSQKRGLSRDDEVMSANKKQRTGSSKPSPPRSLPLGGAASSTPSPANESRGLLDHSPTGMVTPEQITCSPDSATKENINSDVLDLDDRKKLLPDEPEYMQYYRNIQTVEQRQRYKADFNAQYDEYLKLYQQVHKVSQKFKELGKSLRGHVNGTRDYENIKNQIIHEYKNVKDSTYLEKRQRCDYLHRKLGHIKKVIAEFDSQAAAR